MQHEGQPSRTVQNTKSVHSFGFLQGYYGCITVKLRPTSVPSIYGPWKIKDRGEGRGGQVPIESFA